MAIKYHDSKPMYKVGYMRKESVDMKEALFDEREAASFFLEEVLKQDVHFAMLSKWTWLAKIER